MRLREQVIARDIGRSLAKTGAIALVVASMGSAGIAGALAQENSDIYGGGMAVGSEDSGRSVPTPVNINNVPNVEVPGVANAVLGEEGSGEPVELGVLDEELPAPVDLGVLGEGMPAPVDIDAIFANLDLPAPMSVTEPVVTEPVSGPDINISGNVGGSAGGTVTMGGDEAGEISIGGAPSEGGAAPSSAPAEGGVSMGGGTSGGGVYGG